jgi:hypothetical protein
LVGEHRKDIFRAIINTLEKDHRLNYSALFKEVNYKLDPSLKNRKDKQYAISSRDFTKELNMMIKERRLNKTEDTSSKKKIKPVYLSLTQKAKIEHRLSVLGPNPEQERLRRIYQLIFFYSAISPIRNISQEQMDKIKNNLEKESWNHTDGSNVTDIVYRSNLPIKYFRIITREFSGVGPKGETKAIHYCKLWSFSEKEIVEIVININRRRTQNGIVTPFIHSLFPLTWQEVNEAFVILRDNYLIAPIQDLFADGLRFVIADETLQDLINEIWSVHWRELELLKNRLNYSSPPSEEEEQWLRRIYGDNEATKIIADADRHRRSEQVRDVQKSGKYARDQIDSHIASIAKKYQTKVRECSFPTDLIENVCFRKIFTKKED